MITLLTTPVSWTHREAQLRIAWSSLFRSCTSVPGVVTGVEQSLRTTARGQFLGTPSYSSSSSHSPFKNSVSSSDG